MSVKERIYKVQDQDEFMSENSNLNCNNDSRIRIGENYGGRGHQSENTGTS